MSSMALYKLIINLRPMATGQSKGTPCRGRRQVNGWVEINWLAPVDGERPGVEVSCDTHSSEVVVPYSHKEQPAEGALV